MTIEISGGKIPDISSPVPTPKFGVFRGFYPPKTPLYDSTPSPKYPQNSGFFGDKPKKIPKI